MNIYLRAELSRQLGSEVDNGSVRDVRPEGCAYGEHDESWYVFRTLDGRWHTYSDASLQLASHATEGAAEAYWEEALVAWGDIFGQG